MKKVFSTIIACAMATMTMSCGNGSAADNDARFDTISYIVGMDIANQIDKIFVPQLKADYDAIVATLEKGVKGDESFTVADVTIDKSSIQELGMKYLGPGIRPRIEAAAADSTGQTEVFETAEEKLIASTLIGADIAFGLEKAPFPIQSKSLVEGINDVHNNAPKFTDEAAQEYMMNYMTVVIPAQKAQLSKEWLATVEKEEKGVQKTESGIIYKIVNEGDMNVKAVNDTDVVKVLYTGKTRNDKVFDSNRWADMPEERKNIIMAYQPDMARDNAIEFPLNGVIAGWTEGMKLVGKGGRIHLWIPAELAYGERGAGQNIGPNEALFFDVELLDVTPAK